MSGIQETLVIPVVVGMKACLSDGIWDRGEGRAARICWICNGTKARRIYSQVERTLHLRVLQDEMTKQSRQVAPSLQKIFLFLNDVYMVSTEMISRK